MNAPLHPLPRPSTVSARIAPAAGLDVLSRHEVARLRDASSGGLHQLLRRCALAVLTQGHVSDDPRTVVELYADFEINVLQQDRGVRLELINAPAHAFVDGRIIRGINELLFAVVRDIVFVATQLETAAFDLDESSGITHAVFDILRNARVLRANVDPNLVVCWGGHSISRDEYEYTKQVGYQLGLRGHDICTGCGPGAMKGPMKGATIAHAKQRRRTNRYIGITEPGIIAAESPNPIVNNLVIMPDIEKRLEAFVRTAHAIIVFPGGVGTAEEILYMLGILLHPDNAGIPFPLIFSGPRGSAAYFEQIDQFLRLALGDDVARHYQIIIDDPTEVARQVGKGIERVRQHRLDNKDAFFFNWALNIDEVLQRPFRPTHEGMAGLNLHRDQPQHLFAADLRRAFSGIVAGNVKIEGMRAIEQHGPFTIRGDGEVMRALDALLKSFVEQQRMKLPGGSAYVPCYRVLVD
ncbi:nucleotide 5'-monophosphate nucleosidase PpnN [Dokdonella sp.]|uniref:nucleotide 5'-monophosphate nucleosidase PpnN n=1 Tax=Dokdonella sp. TaxID=2291710 RepID=UPI0025BE54A3|nr:nucleotide 5'-monophosphate nucleosidase PpnN [Dokdonella sp.]MBX3692044.1 LOG family protein [Dokdonella sp.]